MNQAVSDWEIFADAPAPSPGDRALRQDDIDRLLGLAPDPVGMGALASATGAAGERLPMLDLVFERLARLATASLRAFTGENVEATFEGLSRLRFGEALASCPAPGAFGVFRARELDRLGLVGVDADLVYAVLDMLLGGRGSRPMRIEGRTVTPVERTFVEQLVGLVLQDLGRAFAPLKEIRFDLERLESSPRLAAIDRASSAAIVATFGIEFEDRGGRATIVLPEASLEPIRDLLGGGAAGEAAAPEVDWTRGLAQALARSPVDAWALIGARRSTLAEVLRWKVGDTLSFEADEPGRVCLKIGATRLAHARIGRRGRRLAVRVGEGLG